MIIYSCCDFAISAPLPPPVHMKVKEIPLRSQYEAGRELSKKFTRKMCFKISHK